MNCAVCEKLSVGTDDTLICKECNYPFCVDCSAATITNEQGDYDLCVVCYEYSFLDYTDLYEYYE